jgi:site-specific DNA-methyltransferase (adenine-specific)
MPKQHSSPVSHSSFVPPILSGDGTHNIPRLSRRPRRTMTPSASAQSLAAQESRSPLNKTLSLSEQDRLLYRPHLITDPTLAPQHDYLMHGAMQDMLSAIPSASVDLLFLDPPYNLTKSFNGAVFAERSHREYVEYFAEWFVPLLRVLKPNASVYICGDWRSSAAIYEVAGQYLTIQNRITFEREKGRGAKSNWKNCSEDIWFCTQGKHYTFNVDAVKLQRRVIAPYRDQLGKPKDWHQSSEETTKKFRLTHPSNVWTDITIPFWSMPENTPHPTQKPEKLLAKIILASTNQGDVVFDPFLGSGTTAVVAKKLSRKFIGIELDEEYALMALKRLAMAEQNSTIQGYAQGVFFERNAGSSMPV